MILLVVNLTQGSFKSVQKVRKEEPMPPGPGVLALGTADTSPSLDPEGAWAKASFPDPHPRLFLQCRQRAQHGTGAQRVRSRRKGFCRPQRKI